MAPTPLHRTFAASPDTFRPSRRGELAVIVSSLLFSTGGLFIKLAPMPAMAVVFGRAVITSVFFLVVMRPRLSDARWSTALAYAGAIVTFVWATKATTAANAILLQFTGPVYVLALAPLILRERFRPLDSVFVVLAMAGMLLVVMDDVGAGQRTGNLVAALSGVLFAFTLVFLRRDATFEPAPGLGPPPLRKTERVMASTALGNILAAVIALPFALPHAPALVAPRGLAVLLYLGVVQVGIAYVLLNRGLRLLPVAAAGLIAMLEPIMNPVWVYLGTGERPGPYALLGGAVVLGVIVLRTVLTRSGQVEH